jgi:hypothetical protein
MTPRDRKASARLQAAPLQEQRSHSDAPSAELAAVIRSLERIFQNAAPEERERLLALAREQGLLFSHQLPATPTDQNGTYSPLAQLLNGRQTNWLPLRVQPIEPEDLELDAAQRDAVAKALQTPDLCLIQGLPGTGKRRVAQEIIRQAAARCERVLFVAPRTGVIDSILERVASAATVLPVRCLSRGETSEGLAPNIRRLTFANQLAALKDQALQQAGREAANAAAHLEQSRRQEPLWSKLQELADAQAKLSEQEKSVALRQGAVLELINREAAAVDSNGAIDSSFQRCFKEEMAPRLAELDGAERSLKEIRTKIASLEKDRQERELLLASLRPLVEAKERGQWWTPHWWRALFSGKRLKLVKEIEAADQLAQTALEQRNAEARGLSQQEAVLREALQSARARLIEIETARRRSELDAEAQDLRRERDSHRGLWAEVRRNLGPEYPLPDGVSPAAVREAYQKWQVQTKYQAEQAGFARDWAEGLRLEARHLDRYLRTCANLIAATPSALFMDENFGDAVNSPAEFDLLLAIEAQELSDAEIVRLASRARRVVLIGQATVTENENTAPRGARSAAVRPVSAPRQVAFKRFWETLHCDPRRLPYSWFWEGKRLCCRLRSTSPDQRRWVETETVHDFPEMELRILAQPRKTPVLVEVLFPMGYSIQQAKEYILRELDEWPVSTSGSSIRWDEQPERIVLRLAEPSMPHAVAIALEPGVREMVGGHADGQLEDNGAESWHTCCVEFERAAGWQRQSAEQWIQRRLGLVDLGRTAQLTYPYRMQPALAQFVSRVLFDGQYLLDHVWNGRVREVPNGEASRELPVVFIPVTLSQSGQEAPSEPRQKAGAKEGGKRTAIAPPVPNRIRGLESDLADPHQRNALPEQLRAFLPREGLVNLAEARAVIQALESLVHDSSLRTDVPHGRRPAVGVVALYSAQAELIRRLIALSLPLRAAEVDFLVADPEACRDFECPVVLVSLTRSPGNRVASLGEEPQWLTWALTRATNKILVFGDPSALHRRCQWDGTVEAQDEASSRRERAILTRLVEYVNGTDAIPQTILLGESSRA